MHVCYLHAYMSAACMSQPQPQPQPQPQRCNPGRSPPFKRHSSPAASQYDCIATTCVTVPSSLQIALCIVTGGQKRPAHCSGRRARQWGLGFSPHGLSGLMAIEGFGAQTLLHPMRATAPIQQTTPCRKCADHSHSHSSSTSCRCHPFPSSTMRGNGTPQPTAAQCSAVQRSI